MNLLLRRWGRLSMRSRLLIGILLPVGLLVALNTASLYQQARRAADTAYDRTLLASAKSIGELLDVGGTADQPQLLATVPYAALEAFEADNRSRMFFKITGFQGEMVSGFDDLPPWRGRLPAKGIYAALVDFYDDVHQGLPVRVAVLLQPVAGQIGQGMATIQVAETLELRDTLARQLLLDTLWRQAALLLVIGGVVWAVVQQATRPVRALSAAIEARHHLALEAGDLEKQPAAVVGLERLQRRIRHRGQQLRLAGRAAHLQQLADGLGRGQQGAVVGGVGRAPCLLVEAGGVDGHQQPHR